MKPWLSALGHYVRLNCMSFIQSILSPPLMLLTPINLDFQDSSWREDKIFMSLGNIRNIRFAQIYYVSGKCIAPRPLHNKAGQYGWCLCTGGRHWEQDCQMSWQSISHSLQVAKCSTHTLYCRQWVLSNCSSISSPRVPGDQELLKSWH